MPGRKYTGSYDRKWCAWTSLMGFVLVQVSLEVNPETRFYVQAVCLEGDPKKDGGRASEARKGRQSLKLGLSSRLPLWAPADFGKWCRTCLRVIPPLCSRDVGCWFTHAHQSLVEGSPRVLAILGIYQLPCRAEQSPITRESPSSKRCRCLQCVHWGGKDRRWVGYQQCQLQGSISQGIQRNRSNRDAIGWVDGWIDKEVCYK